MNPEAEPFSPAVSARTVLATASFAALGTLGADGAPFVSLVTAATYPNGKPILLLSALAVHSKNLDRDPRASLMLTAPGGEGGDPLQGARLTLVGTVNRLPKDEVAAARFLRRHPSAAGYHGFGDFGFRGFETSSAHLVAGFGRIVALTAEDLFPDFSGQEEIVGAEADILGHMNADHAEALGLYATKLLGAAPGPWEAVGSDPDGLDLRANGRRARLWYGRRATSLGDVRKVLKELADEARRR